MQEKNTKDTIYEIRNLTFSYRKNGPKVFQNVSFQLEKGELLTVLGHNGCGKSTLFSCMLGQAKPLSGEILLEGKALEQKKAREIAQCVGYVPQTHNPTFAFSVFEFVLMGCAASVGYFSHPGEEEREQARDAIRQMGLEALAQRPYTEISGGERQMVTIARAIAAKPKAILFDEPTAHLDLGKQAKVLNVIKELSEKGYSIIITTHDPNHAFLLGGKTAVFCGGAEGVLVGDPNEILTEERLQLMYGQELKLRFMEEFGRKVCIMP